MLPATFTKDLPGLYKTFEVQKKTQYNDRIINIDRGSFTPLTFYSFGGMGNKANLTIKKVAADKRKERYSDVVGSEHAWLLRCVARRICAYEGPDADDRFLFNFIFPLTLYISNPV